jgi:hypothetical protein
MESRKYSGQTIDREYENGSHPDRSVADLLKSIVDNVQEIIRSEVKLARAEVREEASKAGSAGRSFGIAAVVGLYAGGFLLFTMYHVLALFMPLWGAALCVTIVSGSAAAIMFASGKKMWKQVNAKPEKTIESVKENVAWLKDQTR